MVGQAALQHVGLVEGRATTFEACYARHRDEVYRLCMRYASGRSSFAEDATQEVFLRLFQNFSKIDQEQPVAAWLYTVATRVCISRIRRDRSMFGWLSRLVHREEDDAPNPAQVYEHSELAAAVMRAIDELPARERVVLCMKAFDGKNQKEIAGVLGLSEGYVSQLLSRARAKLSAQGWGDVE
jgi:RNA polymerase sigma-70 factor (ECF subfamily)